MSLGWVELCKTVVDYFRDYRGAANGCSGKVTITKDLCSFQAFSKKEVYPIFRLKTNNVFEKVHAQPNFMESLLYGYETQIYNADIFAFNTTAVKTRHITPSNKY